MENLDTQHGLKGILLSILGLIAAHFVKDLIKAFWEFRNRNKGPTRDEFRDLSKALNNNSDRLMEQKLVTQKMSTDLKRVYLFLKIIAKDKWPAYRKEVEEIEKLNQQQGDL